ncbi:Uma2 family endonuclease [Candidatus Venteria ishoeyi]|uniref:Putative restriction endonuclease domain-containing protein n=1 Tax=Candidatus Venteria ishoeyi TaxID=1899563 RepID=A0A1H6F791_9GAMM|nr:Uma2 family endonuclease [Candidatus Venteria ishoeyi]MDM8545609.1 Uma2 family endonuclease [Candidatus Venteria ishoeyi]SEH06007.1 Uncharacterised protein [Candidatus Venteria ishoeyi]
MSAANNLQSPPDAKAYLASERKAKERHEFVDGIIYAMSGASEAHNLITANITSELHFQMKCRPCKTYSSDMRVKIDTAGHYVYPDVIALCDKAKLEDAHGDTLLNPAVIFEVLSESTETYDRGRKFSLYRELGSVREYLLVAQDKQHIEHYRRQADGQWLLRVLDEADGKINLESLDCTLEMVDIYAKVALK